MCTGISLHRLSFRDLSVKKSRFPNRASESAKRRDAEPLVASLLLLMSCFSSHTLGVSDMGRRRVEHRLALQNTIIDSAFRFSFSLPWNMCSSLIRVVMMLEKRGEKAGKKELGERNSRLEWEKRAGWHNAESSDDGPAKWCDTRSRWCYWQWDSGSRQVLATDNVWTWEKSFFHPDSWCVISCSRI